MIKLDSRTRVISALLLSFTIAACHTWYTIFLGFSLGLGSMLLSNGNWHLLILRLTQINIFFCSILLTVPLAVPGKTLIHYSFLSFSWEGLILALHMTAKGNAIFLIFYGLIAPLSPSQFGTALTNLGLSNKLSLIFALTYRYLDLMQKEWHKMFTSAKLRGFIPNTSYYSWRTHGLLLALLFMRILDRSASIHQAMICRNFSGHFRGLETLHWNLRDTTIIISCCLLVITTIFLETIV